MVNEQCVCVRLTPGGEDHGGRVAFTMNMKHSEDVDRELNAFYEHQEERCQEEVEQ